MPSDDDHRQAHMTPIFVNYTSAFLTTPSFNYGCLTYFVHAALEMENKGNK